MKAIFLQVGRIFLARRFCEVWDSGFIFLHFFQLADLFLLAAIKDQFQIFDFAKFGDFFKL